MPEDDPQIGWVTFYHDRTITTAYARCFNEECMSNHLVMRALYLSQVEGKFRVKCSTCGFGLYYEPGLPLIFNAEIVRNLTEIEIIAAMIDAEM